MTKQKVFVLLTETSTHANVEVYTTRKEYQARKEEIVETMKVGEFVAVRKNLIFQPDGGLPTLKPLSLRAPLGDVSISLEAIRKFASVNNLELYSRGRDTINFQLLLVGQLAGLFTEEFCKETIFTLSNEEPELTHITNQEDLAVYNKSISAKSKVYVEVLVGTNDGVDVAVVGIHSAKGEFQFSLESSTGEVQDGRLGAFIPARHNADKLNPFDFHIVKLMITDAITIGDVRKVISKCTGVVDTTSLCPTSGSWLVLRGNELDDLDDLELTLVDVGRLTLDAPRDKITPKHSDIESAHPLVVIPEVYETLKPDMPKGINADFEGDTPSETTHSYLAIEMFEDGDMPVVRHIMNPLGYANAILSVTHSMAQAYDGYAETLRAESHIDIASYEDGPQHHNFVGFFEVCTPNNLAVVNNLLITHLGGDELDYFSDDVSAVTVDFEEIEVLREMVTNVIFEKEQTDTSKVRTASPEALGIPETRGGRGEREHASEVDKQYINEDTTREERNGRFDPYVDSPFERSNSVPDVDMLPDPVNYPWLVNDDSGVSINPSYMRALSSGVTVDVESLGITLPLNTILNAPRTDVPLTSFYIDGNILHASSDGVLVIPKSVDRCWTLSTGVYLKGDSGDTTVVILEDRDFSIVDGLSLAESTEMIHNALNHGYGIAFNYEAGMAVISSNTTIAPPHGTIETIDWD